MEPVSEQELDDAGIVLKALVCYEHELEGELGRMLIQERELKGGGDGQLVSVQVAAKLYMYSGTINGMEKSLKRVRELKLELDKELREQMTARKKVAKNG